jgi:hypothetical protein
MLVQEVKQKLNGFIASRDINGIKEVQDVLVSERMRMDKFFSDFLGNTPIYGMEPDKTDTPRWRIYKSNLKEYDSISSLLSTCSYYTKWV